MERKKIALLGNMNNNFFSLCRYLRDAGFDAHLLLMEEMDHFLPDCDTFDTDYKEYTHQTLWHQHYFFDERLKKKIEDDLDGYDLLIGCDWAPAYLKLIGRKLDIFAPYGGDLFLFTYATDSLSLLKQLYRKITNKWPSNPVGERVSMQISGIAESSLMIAEHAHTYEPVVNEKFRNLKRGVHSVPMVYDIFRNLNGETLKQIEKEPALHTFNSVAHKFDNIFISHMRHCWLSSSLQDDNKGNDIVIKAFARFLKTNNRNAALVFFKYGVDVSASEKLVDELGIRDNIIWLPKTSRKYILYMLKQTSLVIGEIAHSYYSYGIVQEALTMKVPLVHNFHAASLSSGYDKTYSCFHASNEQELTDVMNRVADNDFDKERMVEDSYKWYYDQLVNRFINTVKGEIAAKYPS